MAARGVWRPGAVPALFVPSLVNRAYVLDLAPGRSMLRWLAAHGIRPLLLDWGWPGEAERRFTMTDYVAGRMERAMAAAGPERCWPAIAWAARWRSPRRSAGPTWCGRSRYWRHRGISTRPTRCGRSRRRSMLPLLEPALAFNQTLPVDMLQVLFALLDPWGVADKYRSFARLDPASERATCSSRWRTG